MLDAVPMGGRSVLLERTQGDDDRSQRDIARLARQN
jgi:hypothetical protein